MKYETGMKYIKHMLKLLTNLYLDVSAHGVSLRYRIERITIGVYESNL